MYNTVDLISSQLVILHMPRVIYMPSRNGPEHIHTDISYIYSYYIFFYKVFIYIGFTCKPLYIYICA